MPRAQVGLNCQLKKVEPERIHSLLEPGELGAMLDLKVFDPKTGKITEQLSKKAESYVKQFLQMLFIKMGASVDVISMTDTGGVARNVSEASYPTSYTIFETNAAITDVNYGIIIGTGSTAPTINDNKIETLIAHATMNYSAVTFGAPAADNTTSQFTITRNFANVSGGAVTVNEFALYTRHWDGAFRYFCLIRDVIGGGIAVPNGQTLTVNYRLQAVL